MKMENLNFELHEKPSTKRNWKTILIVIAICVVLAFAAKYFYDKWQDQKRAEQIKSAKEVKAHIETKIVEQKAKIKANDANHEQTQDSLKTRALQIQKNSLVNHKHYETPEIKTADYSVMHDSLEIAMPD